jgi:hypothetical protein
VDPNLAAAYEAGRRDEAKKKRNKKLGGFAALANAVAAS